VLIGETVRCYVDLFLIHRPMPGTMGIKSVVFFQMKISYMSAAHRETIYK